MTKNKIKLVTFDAYNTLFKPRTSTTTQYLEEATRVGIHVSRARLAKTFTRAYRHQMARYPFYGFRQGMNPRRWWEELVYDTFIGSGVPKQKLDPKFDTLFNSLYDRFTSNVGYEVFPDVLDTLTSLKQDGVVTGVLSNSDERITDVLHNLNILPHLDFVLPSYRVGFEKPAHQIYDMALKVAPRPITPDEALHVGDDVHTDYNGALHAGWHALLLDRGKISSEDVPTLESSGGKAANAECIKSLRELYPRVLAMT